LVWLLSKGLAAESLISAHAPANQIVKPIIQAPDDAPSLDGCSASPAALQFNAGFLEVANIAFREAPQAFWGHCRRNRHARFHLSQIQQEQKQLPSDMLIL
jgi:hypothetical protein